MGIFEKVKTRLDTEPVLARKAIMVLLAAKVSTLSEGLFNLEENGDTQPWSKGGDLDNLRVIMATRELAGATCDRNAIMTLFDQLVARWYAAADSVTSQFARGMEYLEGASSVIEDPEKALPLLIGALRAGDPKALRSLGECYLEGRNVTKSFSRAALFLNHAVRRSQSFCILS